jgi:hypothetical protein
LILFRTVITGKRARGEIPEVEAEFSDECFALVLAFLPRLFSCFYFQAVCHVFLLLYP